MPINTSEGDDIVVKGIRGGSPKEISSVDDDGVERLAVDAKMDHGQGNPAVVDMSELRYDAFGRLRISGPNTILELDANGTMDTVRYLATKNVGGGTSGIAANEPSFKLSVGMASGDKAVIATRRKIHYFKSNSQHIYITGRFSAGKTGLRQRYGYFTDTDGLFFQMDGTTFSVVKRSSVGGSVVDTVVNQSSWNKDKLDGTGPSGLTANLTKQFVFTMDFGWLGSLGVRYYMHIGMRKILIHQMDFSGLESQPYMYSGFSSIRCEIENTAITASASDMFMTCAGVQSEGNILHHGVVRSMDTGFSPIPITATEKVVAGMKIKSSFVNFSSVKAISFSLNPTSGNNQIYYKLIYNPTLVGATWASAAEGVVDLLSNTPTSFSGGSILASGFVDVVKAGSGNLEFDVTSTGDVWLGADLDSIADSIIIVVRSISGAANLMFSGLYREYL